MPNLPAPQSICIPRVILQTLVMDSQPNVQGQVIEKTDGRAKGSGLKPKLPEMGIGAWLIGNFHRLTELLAHETCCYAKHETPS